MHASRRTILAGAAAAAFTGAAHAQLFPRRQTQAVPASGPYAALAAYSAERRGVSLLIQKNGDTLFELEHAAVPDPNLWGKFGPGAVGVGWDLTLLGLALHLQGGSIEDPEAWGLTPEARELMIRSSDLVRVRRPEPVPAGPGRGTST